MNKRPITLYTDHNSKFRLSENILGPYLKVTQSRILAILCVLLWVGSIATSKYDPNLLPEKTKFRIAIGIHDGQGNNPFLQK